MSERRPTDFYPTPPCAMTALGAWLRQRGLFSGAWLDPAAGAGTALHWMGVPFEDRWAMEYRWGFKVEETLTRYVPRTQFSAGVNALCDPWPVTQNVFTNPPFNLLDGFFARLEALGRFDTLGTTIMMGPTQWWQAQKRTKYRKPDCILAPCWRLPFAGEGSAQHDTCFAIWDGWAPRPATTTTIEWVERPNMPRKGPNRHPVWDEFAAVQPTDDELDLYLDV